MTKPNRSQYQRGDIVTGAVCAWPDGLRHDIEPYPFYSRERTFCEEHSTQQRRVKKDPETGERNLVTEEYSLGTYTETKSVTFRLLASWARWWQFQNKVTNLSRRVKPEPSPEALMLGVSGDGDPFEWELDRHPQYRAEGVMRIVTKRGRKTYRKTLVDFLMGRTTVTQRRRRVEDPPARTGSVVVRRGSHEPAPPAHLDQGPARPEHGTDRLLA